MCFIHIKGHLPVGVNQQLNFHGTKLIPTERPSGPLQASEKSGKHGNLPSLPQRCKISIYTLEQVCFHCILLLNPAFLLSKQFLLSLHPLFSQFLVCHNIKPLSKLLRTKSGSFSQSHFPEGMVIKNEMGELLEQGLFELHPHSQTESDEPLP